MFIGMIFEYEEIKSNTPEEVAMSIDDITLYPKFMKVSVGGENILIGPDADIVLHVNLEHHNCYLDEDAKTFKVESYLERIWMEDSIETFLDDEEDIKKVLKTAYVDIIVPYTEGVLIKNLKLKEMEIFDQKIEKGKELRVLSVEECEDVDTEQYDENGECWFNYDGEEE